jgi:hypothetical protein
MLMARDGVATDTLLSIPFGRSQWTISDPEHPRRGALYTSQPFADGPLWSFVPTDRALVIVEREAPVDAGEARFSVAKVAFSGDTVFSRFYPFEAVPVQPDEADSILDAMGERFGQTGLQGTTAGRWRQWAELTFYRPDFHPGVTDLVVAKDRSIWLALGGRGTNQAVWLVLDGLGEPMGSITLPADAKILLVDPPRLWTYETDDLDVPYLVRYRVDREGAAL